MIQNIRYFAPTWCALFFLPLDPFNLPSQLWARSFRSLCFLSVARFFARFTTHSWLPRYGRVQQKTAYTSFACFYFSICVLFHHEHQCVRETNQNDGTNQNRLCYLPNRKQQQQQQRQQPSKYIHMHNMQTENTWNMETYTWNLALFTCSENSHHTRLDPAEKHEIVVISELSTLQ